MIVSGSGARVRSTLGRARQGWQRLGTSLESQEERGGRFGNARGQRGAVETIGAIIHTPHGGLGGASGDGFARWRRRRVRNRLDWLLVQGWSSSR